MVQITEERLAALERVAIWAIAFADGIDAQAVRRAKHRRSNGKSLTAEDHRRQLLAHSVHRELYEAANAICRDEVK